MALRLYGHPFSSYCMKAIIALHEREVGFALALLSQDDPETGAQFAELWPLAHMPVLEDGEQVVAEATIIIERLDLNHGEAAPMVPADPRAALRARFLDRVFDNYVMTPMQRIVFDVIRPPEARSPAVVADARAMLDRAYAWLDSQLAHGGWAAGSDAPFGLADCAAAPALLYADWVRPIPHHLESLRAYRARALARPSVARAVDAGRPYRANFPPGAPDRD